MVGKTVSQKLKELKEQEWDSDSDIESEPFHPQIDHIAISDNSIPPAPSVRTDEQVNKSHVIYLGRIPHGFYEEQMHGFFQQFGQVTRLKIPRNKKTGRSKHYAFVEFLDANVAQIVADTMNNYRLFDHTLSCHVIPPESVHEMMFRGAGRAFKPFDSVAENCKRHNEDRTYEQEVRRAKRLRKSEKKKRKALELLGINYDFVGYTAPGVGEKRKHIQFKE